MFVAIENTALHRCFVGIVGKRVPGAENDVIEFRERDEIADKGRAVFRSLAKADSTHLGERAYGLAATATSVLNTADERRGDGAEADEKDAEAALCWLDRVGFEFDEIFCFQDHTSLAAERHEWHLPLRGYPPCPRPVFNCALPFAKQGSKRALTAEASDNPLGGIHFFFHDRHDNENFVIMQVAKKQGE